ncbi:MAG TPA: acyl-CoA dehydrogenase family protein, partial [Actinomycetes bacterium]|nr:acyl-CoA dehydrogenase family protein [Actinomycetes bacterium]
MDFRETAEQTMLREAVAKIAADYGHDYFLAKAKAGEKTTELWQAVSGAGFVGVSLPAEHGGGGMGISELAIVTEELAAHGCPLLLLMVSPAICGTLLARFGTPAQRERWLPPIASGERKMVFAITEPDAGSNTHRLETVATRDGDGWRLSGRKHYISGVDEADAVLVVSRTGVEEGAGRGRLSLFIVDTDAPGLERAPIELHVSAPDRQFFLFLDDVRVPGDRLLGEEGDGLRQVFHGLNPERIIGAAIGNGIARYALTRAAAYAGQRQVWDVPIGAHQGLAHPL